MDRPNATSAALPWGMLFVLVWSLVNLTGCGKEQPKIVNLTVTQPGSEIPVGKETGVTASMNNPGRLPLTYKWETDKGVIKPDPSSDEREAFAKFTAPAEEGTVYITLRAFNGDTEIDRKRQQITVVSAQRIAPTPVVAAGLTPSASGLLAAREWCVPFGRLPIPDRQIQGAGKIENPKDCTEVQYITTLSGTHDQIPADAGLWVLVYPKNAVYYPQSNDTLAGMPMQGENGRWSVNSYFGLPLIDAPEVFDVVLVVADQSASKFFSDTLKAWAKGQNYPGISPRDLPSGIKEVHRITVQRRR